MEDNPLDYPQEVWRLFRDPPRAGRFAPTDPGVLAAEVGTRAGGFRLRLECRARDGHVCDARFQAFGCPYTIAVGAWLAQWCLGRTRSELAMPPVAELRAELEIPDDRAHCWIMAQDVLRELVAEAV